MKTLKEELQNFLETRMHNSNRILVDCWDIMEGIVIDITDLSMKDLPSFCKKIKQHNFKIDCSDYGASYWDANANDYIVCEYINVSIRIETYYENQQDSHNKININTMDLCDIFKID